MHIARGSVNLWHTVLLDVRSTCGPIGLLEGTYCNYYVNTDAYCQLLDKLLHTMNNCQQSIITTELLKTPEFWLLRPMF